MTTGLPAGDEACNVPTDSPDTFTESPALHRPARTRC